MPHNSYFNFKQFKIKQEKSAMKVGIDGVLLGAWTNVGDCKRILDVGTGTGLLALMLAQKCNAVIDAIEIEKNAVEEALGNVAVSKWKDQIHVLHSSFEDYAKVCRKKYNLIISNPPFFNENTKDIAEGRNLARNQNSLQLEDLIHLSSKLLQAEGRLSFIYTFQKLDLIIETCSKYDLHMTKLVKVRPNPSKDFHRVLVEMSKIKSQLIESELIIEHEEHHSYTFEFVELTKDYYLKF